MKQLVQISTTLLSNDRQGTSVGVHTIKPVSTGWVGTSFRYLMLEYFRIGVQDIFLSLEFRVFFFCGSSGGFPFVEMLYNDDLAL